MIFSNEYEPLNYSMIVFLFGLLILSIDFLKGEVLNLLGKTIVLTLMLVICYSMYSTRIPVALDYIQNKEVSIIGEVTTDIKKLNSNTARHINIELDGEDYEIKSPPATEFKKGDAVQFKYLPRTNFITEIKLIEDK